MASLLLALAPALLPVQSSCDAVAATVYRDQGVTAGPIELGHLGLPLVGGPLPRLLVDGGVPGSVGFVGLGVDALTLPIGPGATLFTLPLLFVPFTLDGDGGADLDLAPGFLLPPSTCGSLIVLQAGVLDPAATGGLWYTDGLELHPGEVFDEPTFGGWRSETLEEVADLVVVDLNGDGIDDVVAAEESANRLATMLGDGAGRFGSPVSVSVGFGPFQVAIADLDGDGVTDAVVGHLGTSDPHVLLGLGDGTFAAPFTLPAGHGGGVAVGDVTGDGEFDVIAVAGGSVDELLVFAGDGAGGFAAPTKTPLPIDVPNLVPTPVELADLDLDGALDVVYRSGSVDGPVDYRNLFVLRNDGQGGFTATADSPLIANHEVQSFQLADTNGDGALDILGVGWGLPGITTYLNDGSAGFAQEVTTSVAVSVFYPGGSSPARNAVVHDFDGDGVLDVAVSFISSRVALFAGDGYGSFTFSQSYGVGSFPDALGVAHTDGDAHPDLLVASTGSDDVIVCHGLPGVEVSAPHVLATGAGAYAVLALDREGDGDVDLVALHSEAGELSVHGGDGSGSFSEVQTIAFGVDVHGMTSADVDHDGRDDLLVVSAQSSELFVLLAQPSGDFGAPTAMPLTPGSGPVDLTVADFDGDGNADVVTANEEGGSITLLLGADDGTFAIASETVYEGQEVLGIEACDVDGDGISDLALILDETFFVLPRLRILRGFGDGTFTEILATTSVEQAYDLAIGDLNADGFDDVAVADRWHDVTWVLFGRAPGDAFQVESFPTELAEVVSIGDLDGDGRPEIASVSYLSQGDVNLARCTGVGSTTLETLGIHAFNLPGRVEDLVVADIDGDQRPDLVAAASFSVPLFATVQRTPSPLDD